MNKDIKDRIKALGDYFSEMKVASGNNGEEYIYVTVVFPREWVLDGRTEEKYGVECSTENGITYFWADMDTEFATVFDAIDYNIRVNKDAQEKVVLFNQKINELREIFADEENDIERLRSLVFTFMTDKEGSNLPFNPNGKKKVKTKTDKQETTELVDE